MSVIGSGVFEDNYEEHGNYEVVLSRGALAVFLAIPSSADYRAVENTLSLLSVVPHLGHLYDPLYEAATLPYPVRVSYAGHYGIYYEVNEQRRRIEVDHIVDQRRDPLKRFR